MKIQMVSVFVENPLTAHKFYTEVLGFVSVMYIPEAMLAIVASPEEPKATSLMLEPNENPIAKNYQTALYQAGIPVITFGASDIYKEYEKLKAKGVKFKKEPEKYDWGYGAVFEDTCGNYIQLVQV